VFHCFCMHNASMPSITIRDVPAEVRDELAARAARAGQSLQEHLRLTLSDLARRPSAADWLTEVRRRKNETGTVLSRAEILGHLDADRR
jgi:antitoxin FitA